MLFILSCLIALWGLRIYTVDAPKQSTLKSISWYGIEWFVFSNRSLGSMGFQIRNLLYVQGLIFRFHVELQGSTLIRGSVSGSFVNFKGVVLGTDE